MNQSNSDNESSGPGALIALILVLVIVCGYFGYIGIRNYLSGMVEKYTDTESVELPSIETSQTEVESVMERLETFLNRVEDNDQPVEFTLSDREINILLNNHPELTDLAGGVHVQIKDQQIEGRISLQISESGKMLNGRYLNGLAIFRVGVQQGQPELYIESLEMSGEQLPDFLMGKLRSANLFADSEWDSKTEAVFNRIESLSIRDNKLHILVGPVSSREKNSLKTTWNWNQRRLRISA